MQNNDPVYNRHIATLDGIVTRASRTLRLERFQFITLLTFPLCIFAGHLIHLFSPAEEVNNYFTDKRNIVNQVFVKQGWFWTSIAYGSSLASGIVSTRLDRRALVRSVVRFMVVSAWWFFFTQWFFGYPIMDRVFILSGGQCTDIPVAKLDKLHSGLVEKLLPIDELTYRGQLSSRNCRFVGGNWEGGHDPSGHVFLLSLASILLIFEILKFEHGLTYIGDEFKDLYREQSIRDKLIRLCKVKHVFSLSLVLLWSWMFLVTSIYFHSLKEKLFGLCWCYIVVMAIYRS